MIEALLRTAHVWAPNDRGWFHLVRRVVNRQADKGEMRDRSTVHDLRMNLRLTDFPDCMMHYGVFEIRTVRLLRKLARPGDTVIDIGANIGYLTLLLSRAVGPTGTVHSFEPSPVTIKRLRQNIELNAARNVRVHELALGEKAGSFELYSFGDGDHEHGLASLRPLRSDATATTVTVARLDELLPDVMPRLIKIDIEGAEVGALRGAAAVIRRAKPHIIAEYNRDALKAFGHTFGDLHDAVLTASPDYDVAVFDGLSKRILPEEAKAFDFPRTVNVHFSPKR